MLCSLIIVYLSFNFLSSFIPIWIEDAVSIQITNQGEFFDYISYAWGLKVGSQYNKILFGQSLTTDFFRLLQSHPDSLVNSSFTPDVLNKIALSEDRIRRLISNSLRQENGSLLYATWYDKRFTEESEFSSYPDAESNLLKYSVYMDPVLRLFYYTQLDYLLNEAVNLTYENNGFMYSYPSVKDTSFITRDNTENCAYGASKFAFDDRCSTYYKNTKSSTQRSYIDEPFYTGVGQDLRQIICQKDQVDSDKITVTLCNQMNLLQMNISYVESVSRIMQADPGYFFVVFPSTLSTIFHPNIKLSTTALTSILEMELTSTYTSPTSDALKASFDFSSVETNDILIVTPLDAKTSSSASGIGPEVINLKENVKSNKISFTDSSGEVLKQLLVKPLMVNILSEDQLTLKKEQILLIGMVIDNAKASSSLKTFEEFMRDIIYLLTLFLLQVLLAVTLYSLRFSTLVFQQMLEPIKDIIMDLQKLNTEQAEKFELVANVDKKASPEIYNMRSVIQRLIQVMKAASDAYNQGSDTPALLNYAQAKILYHELGNMRGVGICESNIGTIHLKNNRYGDAIQAYKSAINISTNELNELNEFDEKDIKESQKQDLPDFHEQRMANLNNEKVVLANRMFNLAYACVLESQHTKNQRWQSAIDNFNIVRKMDQGLNINEHRVILISIELAKIYLNLGNIPKAEASLKEAEESLLERAFETLDIPRVILDNKIKIVKAAFAKENGNLYEAVELLTSVLDEGDQYDPSDRKKCLEELQKIFKANNIDCGEINRMLTKFNTKNFEFMFVVDASYSMTGLKIQNAMVTIRKIFSNFVGDDDKIGYIYFNDAPHVIFHLTYKSYNQIQLEKYLNKLPETKGATSLLGTMYLALQEFNENDLDNLPLNKKKKQELERNRWIIMITDGGDDFEDNSERSLVELSKYMQKQNVNLLVVGYTYSDKKTGFLQRLGSTTIESQYIDIDHADDLDPFFRTLVEGPTEMLPELEYF